MRLRAGAALAALLAALAAGCGTGGPASGTADISRGKDLFVKGPPAKRGVPKKPSCASCHTLADAEAAGKIGPNLDEAFRAAREERFKESTIRNIVLDQIRFPTTGSGMPANLVRGDDAEAVAAYVASVVATKPEAGAAAPGGTGKELYTSLGCQGCHSLDGSPSTGPTFKGLFGSKVKLANGKTVTADEAYLLKSILDPDAEIVQGYQPGVMTSAIKKGQVSEADAKKLADFIKTQK